MSVTSIFNINSINDNIFLSCEIPDEAGILQPLYVLPDSGNRAKCLMRHDVFKKLFPNGKLIPVEDKITTAKKGDYLEIMGQSEKKVLFQFANRKYSYTCRPFVVKKIQLPCLLSAHDLNRMKMIMNHETHTVKLGLKKVNDKMVPCPEEFKLPVNLLYNETIQPMEEAIIAVGVEMRTEKSVNLLIQPNEEFNQVYGIHCLETLDEVKPDRVSYMTIVNFTDHPIDLKAGTNIGTASPVSANAIEIPKEEIKLNKQKIKLSAKEVRQKFRKEFKIDENTYLTVEEKNKLLDVLCKYQDVVSTGPADIGRCDDVKCHIETEEGKTVKSQCRPLPPHLKENFKEQLDAWLEKGVVEKASGACPFSSPLVPVRKKNGTIRWAVDFRRLNNISKKDHRPIPNVFERLSSLKATVRKPLRYYGCLDLQDAFHNIPIAEDSRDKTAVITPFGLYRFLRMPFGLHNAPQAFAELISILEGKLAELSKLSEQILIYFDDCLLCAETFEEFLEILELFLSVLRRMNLKINPNKCQLGHPSIKWLGHEVSNDGIQPATELTNTITNWPSPKNITELRALFGTFSYYRRFIPRFAERTPQMRKLLQKSIQFNWTEKQEKEMNDLKESLCSKPILGHPDFTKEAKPFILYVDSSKTGVGAVIAQEQEIQHESKKKKAEVVIAYGSRTLTTGEQHYSAYKKELLGMVYAINHFRYYLYGKKFIVRTDHRALEWLLKTRAQNAPSLLYRWQDVLSEYDFEIEYVPGSKMGHVDGLSRKGNHNQGTIKDLPDMDQALRSVDDEFWLSKFKVKENKNSKEMKEVNALDRPKRTIKPSSRYSPSEYVDLPKNFYHNTPTLQETTKEQIINTPPASPEIEFEAFDDPDTLEITCHEGIDETTNEFIPEKFPEAIPSSSKQFQDITESVIPERIEIIPFQTNSTTFWEALKEAQEEDPAIQAIKEDLLPMKKKREADIKAKRLLIAPEEPIIPEKIFKRIFQSRNAPDWQIYWNLWNQKFLGAQAKEFYHNTEQDILEIKSRNPNTKELFVIPDSLKETVLKNAHDDPSVLHPGGYRTYLILRDRVWWPRMKTEIQEYVNNCNTCKRKKRTPDQNIEQLGETTSKDYPALSRWSMDIISFTKARGPQGYCKLLTLMDYNTRWLEAYPITNEQTHTIIRNIRKNFIPRFGLGCHFVADNGKSFISTELKAMMEHLGGLVTHTIPYNPQANPVERAHREINQKIRIALEEKPENQWIDFLENVLLAYRTTPSGITKKSPYFLLYGREPTMSIDILCKPPKLDVTQKSTEEIPTETPPKTIETQELNLLFPLTKSVNLVQDRLESLQEHRNQANLQTKKRHEQNQQQKLKKCKKAIVFKKGQQVDLWRPYDLKNPLASRKLANYWSGPYKVFEHDLNIPHLVTILLENPKNRMIETRKVFVNHLRPHGKKPKGLWHQLPTGFPLWAKPLTNKYEFKANSRLQQLTQEIERLPEARPEVLEKLNEPNIGYEVGLRRISPKEVDQFKDFYTWSQQQDDDDDDNETYYYPGFNEPIEYIVENEDFEIIEEDVPIQEEDQPQRITPEPEDYPEATAPMEELTESPTPQTPEQMETQTPRIKRNIDEVMHSPTKENTTKKTRINLNINHKN